MARDDRADAATTGEVMPAAEPSGGAPGLDVDGRARLASEWKRFGRIATLVAVATAPALFVWLHEEQGRSILSSALLTIGLVIAVRGFIEVVVRRFIPWPSLFGHESEQAQREDVLSRRRVWFWRRLFRWVFLLGGIVTIVWAIRLGKDVADQSWVDALTVSVDWVVGALSQYAVIFVVFFFINFAILFGPLAFMGISQIRAYEPGDADWGVRLDDVRGQAEAKEEVRRVVALWQSGEAFESAGGKRERGLLMLGAPGTGKTMLSKAIATNFNAPFISIPGSGFAQTFIGMDVIIVRYLAWKAKRMARKWGGQAIIFIDEIDAVGMRRASLGTSYRPYEQRSFEELAFFGPWGSLTPTGDLFLETRAWRDRLFTEREASPQAGGLLQRVGAAVNVVAPGMFGGGGQLALNQLLVVMDGIGDPPFLRRFWTNRVNTILDATYIVPQRIGSVSLRVPRPRPRTEQIFFIGACNAPLEALDPALTRPGRMGRHVWFRTPTRNDRLDIFNLYLSKVSHEPDLDTPKRRDELARVTNGYSPAMIEQVCSMALTIAHHNGRERFGWGDIVDAMTNVESGTAINVEYIPEETRAVAIHEAGHAVAAHVYMEGTESTRISIRRRGGSLGHHQALQKDERFTSWEHEEMGRLTWTLGAMAAEHVFYGENSTGVGGDVQSATMRAAWMVGSCAMAPSRIDFEGRFDSEAEQLRAERRAEKRLEEIGMRIMQRAGGGGMFERDPISGVLGDPWKRSLAARILGEAYLSAYHVVRQNRAGVERVADVLVEKREVHGDEVTELLDACALVKPTIDLLDDATWPKL